MRPAATTLLGLCLLSPVAAHASGSAIFLHPDGMAANTWSALRLKEVGPDGRLAWDKLPRLAIYVGPMTDSVNASSNGGATTHAYGVRASLDSYGSLDGGKSAPMAASGKRMSIALEAKAAGKRIAFVNSSSLTEPGTGAFLASVPERDDESPIALQMLEASPDILLGGGEQWFLPEGTHGVHGPGKRKDGRNLVEEARSAGYAIIYTRDELLQLPAGPGKLLGLFAADETFNEGSEEALEKLKWPWRQPQAPGFDEMIAAVLARVADAPQGYLVVANHETTDNLSGENNTVATLEAAAEADRAIAMAVRAAGTNPDLTVLVASDSDNGGMNATGDDINELPRPLPDRTKNGSPLDSDRGQPWLSPPDARGQRQPFYITWASDSDSAGGTIARGTGPGAELIEGTIDSTDIYRALYLGLFGKRID